MGNTERQTEIEQLIARLAAESEANPIATELETMLLTDRLVTEMVHGLIAWMDEYVRPILLLASNTVPNLHDDALHKIADFLRNTADGFHPDNAP